MNIFHVMGPGLEVSTFKWKKKRLIKVSHIVNCHKYSIELYLFIFHLRLRFVLSISDGTSVYHDNAEETHGFGLGLALGRSGTTGVPRRFVLDVTGKNGAVKR